MNPLRLHFRRLWIFALCTALILFCSPLSAVNAAAQTYTGVVTENGKPASGVPILMMFYDGIHTQWYNTFTDQNGGYSFPVPAIGDYDQYFQVYYRNLPYDHPAEYNPNRIPSFDCNIVRNLTAPMTCNFDIGIVRIIGPKNYENVSMPFTFTWQTRSVPEDHFQIEINEGNGLTTDDLGNVSAYTFSDFPDAIPVHCAHNWRIIVSSDYGHGVVSVTRSFYYIPSDTSGSVVDPPLQPGVPAGDQRVYLPFMQRTEPKHFSGGVVNMAEEISGALMHMAYSTDGGKTYNMNFAETHFDAKGYYDFIMPPVGDGKQFYVYFQNESNNRFFFRNFSCNVVDSLDDLKYCNFLPGSSRISIINTPFEVNPPLTLRAKCSKGDGDQYGQVAFYDYDSPDTVVYKTEPFKCMDNTPNQVIISEFPRTMSLHHYYNIEVQTLTPSGIGRSFDYITINPISYR
jgi:hypothetical protein